MTVDETLQLAISYHKQGNLQEAERLYRAILQTDPKHSDANHNLGIIAIGVGMISAAIPFLKQAIETNSTIAQYHLSYDNAINKLDSCVLDSKAIDTIIELFSQGNCKEALPLAVRFTKSFPKNGLGWKALGALFIVLGNTKEALDGTINAVRLLPEDSEAYSNLGAIYRSQGKLMEAEESLRKAIALKPDYIEAHSNLGGVLKYQGRFLEAEQSYRTVIDLNPNAADAYNNLGFVLHEMDRLNEAEECYRKAIELKPDYVEAYNNLGVIYAIGKKMQEAEAYYRKVILLKPDYAPTYHSLGMLLKDNGELLEAEKYYRKAIELKPDYAEVYVNLGYLLYYLDKTSEAMKAYKECIKLSPRLVGLDASVHLAILYYLNGDLKESYASLEMSNNIFDIATDKKYKNSASYWIYLDRLHSWHKNNKQKNYNLKDIKTMYVVGESHSLTVHGMIVRYDNEEMICSAEWILGCKQWHLGNDMPNWYKHKFEAIMARLPNQSTILLTFGEIDCRHDEGIIKAWKKSKEKKLENVIQETIRAYLLYVEKITGQYKHQIIINGIPAINNIESDNLSEETVNQIVNMIRMFNTILNREALSRGMDFLDVYTLTDRGDGIASGHRHIDSHHLIPSAVCEAFDKK